MRRLGIVFVVAIAAGFVTGCGQFGGSSPSSRGGIAVVDLDKVAAETGRDRQLAQSLELAQNSLNESYAKSVEMARGELDSKKKGYGDEISDDEKKEFSDLERVAVNKLSQLQNQARQKFEQYKLTQITRFRADLKPIAQEIASKRGLSVVVPKNEGLLLSVDPGVDITDDVIKVLREKHPVVATTSEAPASTAKSASAKRSSSSAKTAARANADDEETFDDSPAEPRQSRSKGN